MHDINFTSEDSNVIPLKHMSQFAQLTEIDYHDRAKKVCNEYEFYFQCFPDLAKVREQLFCSYNRFASLVAMTSLWLSPCLRFFPR